MTWFKKKWKQKQFTHRIRQLTFLAHMRKEVLENVILVRHSEGENGRGKQRVIYQTSFCKWLTEKGLADITEKKKQKQKLRAIKPQENVDSHDCAYCESLCRINKVSAECVLNN